ncbi:transcriptional regulator GcvA [Salinarimonas ramus]|uniref:Transcriptional regulator n=1 Tax=Salinarimonas ramus TaxID=690164 RepID=A0A917QJ75_9HYPH|nr:transcriptional regulator GcvA [Salinarimonas ramus]GGK53149.1 transcriptional regulator [Salinarimonas ramus]
MSTNLPPLATLRAFEAVARLGSFTAAARELCLTQTAVSHQIRTLEECLSCRVLFRTSRSVVLTSEGADYLDAVRPSLRALEAATHAVRGRGRDDALVLSVYPSFAAKWLVPRLGGFQAQHPQIRVRIEVGHELVDPHGRGDLLAIRYGRGSWPGLSAQRLFGERLLPVAAPRLLNALPLDDVADLAAHRALHDIACDGSADGWARWIAHAGHDEIAFAAETAFGDSYLLLAAALDGLGVALGRALLVADDLAAGRLVAPFDLPLDDAMAYWLVSGDPERDGPAARAFRGWIDAEARAWERRARIGGTAAGREHRGVPAFRAVS